MIKTCNLMNDFTQQKKKIQFLLFWMIFFLFSLSHSFPLADKKCQKRERSLCAVDVPFDTVIIRWQKYSFIEFSYPMCESEHVYMHSWERELNVAFVICLNCSRISCGWCFCCCCCGGDFVIESILKTSIEVLRCCCYFKTIFFIFFFSLNNLQKVLLWGKKVWE